MLVLLFQFLNISVLRRVLSYFGIFVNFQSNGVTSLQELGFIFSQMASLQELGFCLCRWMKLWYCNYFLRHWSSTQIDCVPSLPVINLSYLKLMEFMIGVAVGINDKKKWQFQYLVLIWYKTFRTAFLSLDPELGLYKVYSSTICSWKVSLS